MYEVPKSTYSRNRIPRSLFVPWKGTQYFLEDFRLVMGVEARFMSHMVDSDESWASELGDELGAAFEECQAVLKEAGPYLLRAEDEFAACATGIAIWEPTASSDCRDPVRSFRTARSSYHALVFALASKWVGHVQHRAEVCLGGKDYWKLSVRDQMKMGDSVTGEHVATFVRKCLVGDRGFLPDSWTAEWMSAHLSQEVGRAMNQRLLTKRSYPDDQTDSGSDILPFDDALGPGEKRVLEIVSETGTRMTTDQIVAALERKYGTASLGTTKQHLASLRRRRLLTNRQDVIPRGYGLPEWDVPGQS